MRDLCAGTAEDLEERLELAEEELAVVIHKLFRLDVSAAERAERVLRRVQWKIMAEREIH